MPKESVIAEGKTTNEAIENGLKKLGVSKNKVNVKIIESEDKKSFFSILAPRIVKVELTLKEEEEEKFSKVERTKKERKPVSQATRDEAQQNVSKFLDEFIKQIGDEISYKINQDEMGLQITIEGEKAGFLIGYRGETLYALQNIISTIVNKKSNEKVRILLDIENYKHKREETLQTLAKKIARRVEKSGKAVTLEPMQAYERKIIHSCLQESTIVKTESIGEEPRRRVVISLKK